MEEDGAERSRRESGEKGARERRRWTLPWSSASAASLSRAGRFMSGRIRLPANGPGF